MFITAIQFPKLMVTGGDNMQKKKEINIQMGSRIRKARLQAGLTQEAFAELLNLGPKHISAIERGIVGLSMETLQNICQVLHVSADTLLFGDIEKSPADTLCQRLGRLSPEEFAQMEEIVKKILEIFAKK